MELIVHGQLYYYGLIFSPDWADSYRIFTWLIFLCLGLPMALSGLALVSSFFKVEKDSKKPSIIPQTVRPKQGIARVESRPVVREVPKRVENGYSAGISCPQCKKVFGRALVMLDFRSGKNRLVNVCPYCNHVLGSTSAEEGRNLDVHVASSEEKIVRE